MGPHKLPHTVCVYSGSERAYWFSMGPYKLPHTVCVYSGSERRLLLISICGQEHGPACARCPAQRPLRQLAPKVPTSRVPLRLSFFLTFLRSLQNSHPTELSQLLGATPSSWPWVPPSTAAYLFRGSLAPLGSLLITPDPPRTALT